MKTVFIPTRFKDPLPPGAPEHGAVVEQNDGGSTEMKPARRWPDGRIEVADVERTLSGFLNLDEATPDSSGDLDDGSDLEVAAMVLICEARRAAKTLEAIDELEGGPSDHSRLAASLREAAENVSRALDTDEEET